jgi:twinkle protein
MLEDDGFVTDRERCPKCASLGNDRSGDNLAVYNDGHKYCFACGYYERNGEMETVTSERTTKPFNPYKGECLEIADREITQTTARRYNYETCIINGKKVELANFYKDGVLIAQHMRGPNKTFHWNGSSRVVPLWGQHLWKSGGKRIVITEGEYDCMTVNQLLGGKWAVVSLPNGAASAAKSIKDNLEFVSSYDEIVIMFDQDEAGKKASQVVAELLPPGKCKIASLPLKDANECMIKGHGKDVINAMWEAQLYSPDEIVHVSQVIANTPDTEARVYPFPFNTLTEFLIGQRSGEITLWASGTGSGKSTILRELIHHHLEESRSVGAIMLEESPQETVDDMVSLMINKPVRAIKATRIMNELREKMGKEAVYIDTIDDLTDEEYAKARRELSETSFYVYDHLGNSGLQNLCARIEYMAVSLEVDVIVLDHITAAACGLMGESSDYDGGNSERLLIDNIMKQLRALVSRTGVRIDVVSQLKKTQKAYEEGDRITLQDLRGSGSLASVPNVVIGLERDRQNPDDRTANTTTVRVLKNRLTGRAGVASTLYFNRQTGRLEELEFAIDDSGAVSFQPVGGNDG